jgi:hypothetical protein
MILVPAHRECTRDFLFELNLFSVGCLGFRILKIDIYSVGCLK